MSTTATEVVITIPRCSPSGNELRRAYRHWAVYKALKDSWVWDIKAYARQDGKTVLFQLANLKTKMRIHIEVGRPRLLDKDNLYSGCKPVLDAMRELGLLYQDSPKYLELQVTQHRAAKNSTEIRISEAQ